MPKVSVIQSFEHNGMRRLGDQFTVSLQAARKLRDRGLVEFDDPESDERPSEAAGNPSSASPAAQASHEPTATPRKRGRKPKKVEA